jgi:glycosyltransferase involved in cell wall biosynthesis
MGVDKGRIDIVPNFVDVTRLSRSKNLAFIREQYGIAKTGKLVLYLGRLHRAKRIDLVIRAFNMLVPEMDNVMLVLAGPDAGYREGILNLVRELGLEEKVMVVEHVEDVGGLYSIADVLVYPAKTEIFGLVPFEALACGTPVIVSSGSGCSELINEVDCGVVVDCDDTPQLKNAIKDSLCNPDTARASANKGREYVLKYLNRSSIIHRIEEIYERCVA